MTSGNLVRFLPKTADGTFMSTKVQNGSYGIIISKRHFNDHSWVFVMFNNGMYEILDSDLCVIDHD